MEMMNRAIEDASDFMDMKRRLLARMDDERATLQQIMSEAPRVPPKRPGENRQQYSARIHGKVSA